ncbi:MAG TPA: hypothetical protein VNS09_24360 [Solirubrobacter sp.]|nr:hypothetical protein [Solirubrobacter sp.]
MRRLVVLCACLAVVGCGESGKSSYTAADVKAAYYTARDGGADKLQSYFVDEDYHSHSNYVPIGGLEVCPLAQRASYDAARVENMIEPKAAQPVRQFIVEPKADDDDRTPKITQGALVFGTGSIASDGMRAVGSGMTKCPATYEVRSGPSPILGTYRVSARPIESGEWKGVMQQIAHTYPAGQDDVYYEDLAHVVVQHANVILYLDVTHRKVIGERSDAATIAESALRTVLKRLG